MAGERLYDFLSKVVNQDGNIHEGEGGGRGGRADEKKKDLIGESRRVEARSPLRAPLA